MEAFRQGQNRGGGSRDDRREAAAGCSEDRRLGSCRESSEAACKGCVCKLCVCASLRLCVLESDSSFVFVLAQ